MGKCHIAVVLVLAQLSMLGAVRLQSFDDNMEIFSNFREPEGFQPLAMIQLEEHENTPTPPFSVCQYLLETAATKVSKDDKWHHMANHIAGVREALPEHVRSACDAFIKHNRDDIISLLQFPNELESQLMQIGAKAEALEESALVQQSSGSTSGSSSSTSAGGAAAAGPTVDNQQEIFKKFWEEKGKFCGACLTLTKKIQKWLSLNCTQTMISDRVVRMCQTMDGPLREQCMGSQVWIQEYVLKNLLTKIPLPNHCAYIGLCEKTMVIRALANPISMSDKQSALIQALEGVTPNLEQEGESVLQQPRATATTNPEITFDLSDGGISYRDVDKASGAKLPKVIIDGPVSLLETASRQSPIGDESDYIDGALLGTEAKAFDLSNPDDPHVELNAQDEDQIDVSGMHLSMRGQTVVDPNTFNMQGNHLPIETKYLKGCAACQFTIGALFEFLSNPRTIRAILPAVKAACNHCNSPDEVQKCEEFVETQGVAFYQDVIRQGLPSKWCPRLELCEIQYFYPSPFVLSDAYHRVESQIKQISDF